MLDENLIVQDGILRRIHKFVQYVLLYFDHTNLVWSNRIGNLNSSSFQFLIFKSYNVDQKLFGKTFLGNCEIYHC